MPMRQLDIFSGDTNWGVINILTFPHVNKDLRNSLQGRGEQNGKLKSSRAQLLVFL